MDKNLNRNIGNSGAFNHLAERMSKKHIRDLADECGISLKGITLTIDRNEELLNIPIAGRADSEKIGGITFFPNAFVNREELIRTLHHEMVHVRQFKEYGTVFVQNNRVQFEEEAYKSENEFVKFLKETGVL